MFGFELACKDVERLDPKTYREIVAEKSARVIKTLTMISDDEVSATSFFTGILLGAVICDGVLDEAEFNLIKPMMDVALGKEVTFEDACDTVNQLVPDKKSYKDYVNKMTDLFGQMSDAMKTDIVTVSLLVCAADGKISFKERRWLKELAK